MKVAIMQPTYLPWAGYFNMIQSVDTFIFFDDVQFAKRSWQQRNRILSGGQEAFLTVPVVSKGKRDQLIKDVVVDDSQNWREKHIDRLAHAYGKCPFGKDVIELVSQCLERVGERLIDINVEIIRSFCFSLGIEPRFRFSSELPVNGQKSAYLYDICKYVGADTYLSARGSRDYIEQENVFGAGSIHVQYHDYTPAKYPQKDVLDFVTCLSIVDVVASLGFTDARRYVAGDCF